MLDRVLFNCVVVRKGLDGRTERCLLAPSLYIGRRCCTPYRRAGYVGVLSAFPTEHSCTPYSTALYIRSTPYLSTISPSIVNPDRLQTLGNAQNKATSKYTLMPFRPPIFKRSMYPTYKVCMILGCENP